MDPRKILDVAANASKEEIQQAYRRAAKKHHPDQGGDSWAFQQIHSAYEMLTNSDSSEPAQVTDGPEPVQAMAPTASLQPAEVAELKHRTWKDLFTGQLPLQTQTTWFILANCLDIFMTYVLLRQGAMESNPIAAYFIHRWGFMGAIVFKLVLVASVCVISQIVALKKLPTAKFLLHFGTAIVSAVVVYSVSLYLKHYY